MIVQSFLKISRGLSRYPLFYSKTGSIIKPHILRVMGQNCVTAHSQILPELCHLDDIPDGGMKEVELPSNYGEGKILLLRDGLNIKALSPKCTHYAAPLSKGTYDPQLGTVRCPFHGACFNVETGDIEDYPGLDNLHSYKVHLRESDKKILLSGKKEDYGKGIRRTNSPLKCDVNDNRLVIIVGGGAAAQACLEVLRGPDCRYRGKILLVSNEEHSPYDRPKLSKALGVNPEEILLRQSNFYTDRDIDIKLGTSLKSISPNEKKVKLSDDTTLNYDKIVLATGTVPRVLELPGADLNNIFVLRTPKDANAIITNATGKRVVIIGGSFIGTEVAASLIGKASEVSLVGTSESLFEKTLGKEIGSFVQKMHENKGVNFFLGVKPLEYKSSNGTTVEVVALSDGSEIPADVVVLGVGVFPNTKGYLKDSGVLTDERGYILVNERMETNIEGIYAAGDVVKFPLFTHDNKEVSIGHWGLAKSHGRIAAYNVASFNPESPKTQIKTVPFFWTVQYGKSLRVAGFADSYDEIIYDGSVSDGKFAAFYVKEGKVMSVATLMRDPIAAKFADFLRKGNVLTKECIDDWILSK
ncbi:apoptosis-inducing factor 3 isoform X2 [Lepeophtheirus salmonis]|uniref:apoptosis-inducing factor 3 isoform X2 n=1 Tax=Lepeophtheirus salmonis TaxID=72036 RepID=UPI001AE6DB54|nr:apoptosis-inducing factor 3-like isoform X2 [Lepeophtheirus salmonis]